MDPLDDFTVVGPVSPAPSTTNDFQVVGRRDPTADEVRESLAQPGYTPSYGDAKILEADEQAQAPDEKLSRFSHALGDSIVGVGKSLWKHGSGAAKEIAHELSPSQISDASLAKILATGGEGFARGSLDLFNPLYRAERAVADRMSSADPVALRHARMMEDAKYAAARASLEQGSTPPVVAPNDLSRPSDERLVMPNAAEFGGETVFNPLAMLPAARALQIGPAAAADVAKASLARAAGEGVISRAAKKTAEVSDKVADVATIPGRKVKDLIDQALPGTGFGSTVSEIPNAAGAAVALPARAAGKVAEIAGELGRTTGNSSLGRLEQIAMSESTPTWLRGAARNLSRVGVDKAARFAGTTAKAAGEGAAFGAALSAPGAENAEELGAGTGAGVGYGVLAHAVMSPAMAGSQRRAAQDFDLVRWMTSKSPEEQAAIGSMKLNRDQALRQSELETIANGYLDPNANVRFEYQDPSVFEPVHGKQRAVAMVEADKPTIIFNTARLKDGTAAHELFHVLSRSSDIVDYGALTTKLLGVQDQNGNTMTPGLLSAPDVSRLGDVYYSRLDPIGQRSVTPEKAAFDANPSSPDAAPWKKRIVNEIGAELFSNLSRDTKGSLLASLDKPTLQLVDRMTQGDRAQWVQNWGQKLQKLLGYAPKSESDIFPGLKSTPEIQGMMRDFLRAKKNLTKTPEFNSENVEPAIVVNPRDSLRAGGDEIVKKFPDNDNFAKDAAGNPLYVGGRPVLLTEGEIRKVQTNRAEAMTKALSSVPDTGEAGIVRSQQGPPVPAPLPPGAIPAHPVPAVAAKKASPGFTGRHFSDAQIAALQALPDAILTPSMKAKLTTMNNLAKRGDGSPILLFYNAALKNRRYSSAIRETARVLTPLAMSITKAGNFTVTGLDITAFNAKLHRWLSDKPSAFTDFNGSADTFVEKTQQYLQNHQNGQPGATGLDSDAATAVRMRNRIQDFLNIRDIASEPLNPDRLSRNNDKDGLIRAFRFDRMNRVEPASGDKFPVDYELVKRNYSPDRTVTVNNADEVQKLSPDQFAEATKTWKGGLTGQAIELGKRLTDKDIPTIQKYFEESRARAKQFGAARNFDGAMTEALRGQFYREAMEAYRASKGETGLSIRPEDLARQFSPDAPETTPIGVNPKDKVVDISRRPDNISGMVTQMFSPDEAQFKRARPLPNAVGDARIPIVHFSSQSGLKALDPAYMGKGQANNRDRRGGPKSFFFVAESPLGADEQFFGTGKNVYGAVVSGTRLYDLRVGKADPLGFSGAINPLEAEEKLTSKGYAGVLVEGGQDDPRKTVIMFKRTAVKELPVRSKEPMTKAPRVEFSPDTPSEEIRSQAAEYTKAAGLKTTPHQSAVPVREDVAKRLADAYETAAHAPNDPAVKASYDALARETKAQWNFITGKGVRMEPWTQEGQPYKNSAEMIADVKNNKHLWFFPTDQGFGDNSVSQHPMLAPSGITVDGKPLVINDLFRAVHDYFGHAKEGFQFGPKGEYNAYLAHSKMFSDQAKPALAAETLAQNSWVNYGKHLRRPDGTIPAKGEQGYVPMMDRPYADQKAVLLPPTLVKEAERKLTK